MSDNKDEKIIFNTFDDEKVEFEVIEQTMINGINYLLVCDADDEEETDAAILKEVNINEKEVIYEDVVDETELKAVAKVFAELLDDCDIQG